MKKSQLDVCGATAIIAFRSLINSPSTAHPRLVSNHVANRDSHRGHLRDTNLPILTCDKGRRRDCVCEPVFIIVILLLLPCIIDVAMFVDNAEKGAANDAAQNDVFIPDHN